MSTQQDSSIGIKKEATYGTAVVTDSFFEFTEEDFTWQPEFAVGVGQRVGRRVQAADRRVLVKEQSGGSITLEAVTKGLGKLFEAALGVGVSTLINGTSYQQLFTPAVNDYLPSYTIQKGIPLLAGAAQAVTFLGCVCSGFELNAPNGGIPTLKFNFMGKAVDKDIALAAPSYIAANELYSFVHGSLRVGGSPTVPTTTALSTGGTAAADITDVALTWDNALDSGGFYLGGAGKRGRKNALGLRSGTGTLTAEYDSNVLRDAWLAQTDLALVLTFARTVAISGANFPTLQVMIPNIRLEGDIPVSAGGEVVTQSVGFTVLDGRVAAEPLYVAIVTAETAI